MSGVTAMDGNQLGYLAGLVRTDIRKRQRGLAKFAPKPGQDPAEARAVQEDMAGSLAWKREVLDALDGERKSSGVQAIAQARQYLADGRVPVPDCDLVTAAMEVLASADADTRIERLALAGGLIAVLVDERED